MRDVLKAVDSNGDKNLVKIVVSLQQFTGCNVPCVRIKQE